MQNNTFTISPLKIVGKNFDTLVVNHNFNAFTGQSNIAYKLLAATDARPGSPVNQMDGYSDRLTVEQNFATGEDVAKYVCKQIGAKLAPATA